MTASADVAVVIPVRDGAATLRAAIASVMSGSVLPSEVTVVDDRSTDDSVAIARSMSGKVRLRVIASHGVGAGTARNAGAGAASASWLAFLDADDLWESHRLERGLAASAAAPPEAAIYGRIRQFFDPTLGRTDLPVPEISNACHPNTLLLRRETFLREGGFPERAGIAEIVAWFAYRRAAGKPFVFLPEVLAARRIHARNTGIVRADERGDYVRVVRSLLERRRAAAEEVGDRSASS